MSTLEYLRCLFERCDSGYLTLFRKLAEKSNESKRFSVVDGLDEAARFVDGKRDLYLNVGVQEELLPHWKRGEKGHVRRIPFLWADVDFADKPSAKKKYPTREHADAALRDMPLPPSLVVFSGGGLYPFWLFNEPVELPTIEDALLFEQQASWPWQELLRRKLKKYDKGYELDPKHDVSSMLRVVGSTRSNGHTVCVIGWDGSEAARYDRSDFEQFTPEIKRNWNTPIRSLNGCGPVQIGDLIFDPKAELRPEVFSALREWSDEFTATWDYRRDDFGMDRSRYLFSLVSLAIGFDLKDQEIFNLYISWMRRHDRWEDTPAEAERKTRLAIFKLRLSQNDSPTQPRQAGAALTNDSDSSGHESGSGDEGTAAAPVADPSDGELWRRRKLRIIQKRLRSREIVGAVQFGTENATFGLVLQLGDSIKTISIGTSEQVLGQTKIRARLMEAIRRPPPKVDKEKWPAVVKAILDIAEIREAPSEVEQFEEVLRAYLKQNRHWTCYEYPPEVVVCGLRHEVRDSRGTPIEQSTENFGFFRGTDGRLYVKLTHLEDHLVMKHRKYPNLTELLHKVGFCDRRVRKSHEGKRYEQRYWVHDSCFKGVDPGQQGTLKFREVSHA